MEKKSVILLLCFLIFGLVDCLHAQDTVRVKLGPTNLQDNTFESLKSSQVLLNKLIPAQKYRITTVSGPDSTADLLGLREINIDDKPKEFLSSIPIIISSNYLLGRNSNNGDKIKNILNEDIGVLSSSVASQKLSKLTQFYNSYKSASSLYSAYLNGQIDYIIAESSVAKSILNSKVEGRELNIINRNLFKSNIGFWINQNNPELLKFINVRIQNFKESGEFENFKNQYFEVPKDYSSIFWYSSIAIIAILLAAALTYTYKNQVLIKQYLNSYKLELNGIMQIRPLPGIRFVNNEGEIKNHFQESYAQFQQKHPNINVVVDFNNTSVKLQFDYSSDVKISDKNYLSTIANDIEDMISVFPTDQFIIDLSLSGSYSNLQGRNKFSIINKDTDVEFIDTEIEKNTF